MVNDDSEMIPSEGVTENISALRANIARKGNNRYIYSYTKHIDFI